MSKKKILLIDDDKDFVLAIKALLENLDYEIYIAHSGAEGFTKVQETMPDLIVLDVNMESEFSGFEIHRKIRADKDLGGIPIIILTGIETYGVSSQIIDMYRTMRGSDDFEMNRVLRISDPSNQVAVEYYDESGKPYYLPLDSFITKTKVHEKLVDEIKRFLS